MGVNPVRLLKIYTRAQRLLEVFDAAAKRPALYRDPHWHDDAAHRAADLIAIAPMPQPARTRTMNLLNLIQNIYKAPVTTLAGIGVGYLTFVAAGQSPKAAALALVATLLGGTHPGK